MIWQFKINFVLFLFLVAAMATSYVDFLSDIEGGDVCCHPCDLEGGISHHFFLT